MTTIELIPLDTIPDLPPFVLITPETLASIGSLALPGQEVLIGTLDTKSFSLNNNEAKLLAEATLAIVDLLDKDQKLIFGGAPGENSNTLGIWLSRLE